MKITNICLVLLLLTLLISCKKTSSIVTKPLDYNTYLAINENKHLDDVKTTLAFWESKLTKNPSQYIYLAKIASNEGQLFGLTGNIDYLKQQEKNLVFLNKKTNHNNASYLRSLAKNYITQHRFKESLVLLLKAEKNGEKKSATQKMLFDVYLELGNSKMAEQYLNKIKDFKSFDYLIRLSKWYDHNGDLNKAIYYMESAKDIAEFTKSESLKKWIYTNIADYYGHAGMIKKSYEHYLKTLAIDPNNDYAKKGIAWIAFSHEKNSKEALRIINSLKNQLPDYYLLKAKIAIYMNNTLEKHKNIKTYLNKIENPKYGDMYNKYSILLHSEELQNYDKALKLANTEINNRPTTQSYDLLAWTYFKQGKTKKALKIINEFVVDRTSEPEALFHISKIFIANQKSVNKIVKKELMESSFELGPNLSQEIKSL
jgi:predicted Zn-dependent protease